MRAGDPVECAMTIMNDSQEVRKPDKGGGKGERDQHQLCRQVKHR